MMNGWKRICLPLLESSPGNPVQSPAISNHFIKNQITLKSKSEFNFDYISLTFNWLNCFRKESRLSLSRLKTPPASRLRHISLSSDDDGDDFTPEEIPPSAKRSKLSSPRGLSDESSSDRPTSPILSGLKRTKRPVQLSISNFMEVHSSSTKPNVAGDSRLTKKSALPQPYLQQPQQSSGVLKLNVRIQDKVLLIPVECNKSVKWLSEEAARRYYNMTGLNPILSLHTADGAVLNGEDVVSIILQDGDKVIGEMIKWDLQPLPERYANLCRQLETGFYCIMSNPFFIIL